MSNATAPEACPACGAARTASEISGADYACGLSLILQRGQWEPCTFDGLAGCKRAFEWAASHRAQYDALVAVASAALDMFKVRKEFFAAYGDTTLDRVHVDLLNDAYLVTFDRLADTVNRHAAALAASGATISDAGHAAPAVPASAQGGERQ